MYFNEIYLFQNSPVQPLIVEEAIGLLNISGDGVVEESLD
jgi:hypothetical protein